MWDGVIGKAGNTGLVGAPSINQGLTIFNGDKYVQSALPRILVSFNTGWVAVCNGKNASTCASIPLKLYYRNRNSRKLELTSSRQLDGRTHKSLVRSKGLILRNDERIDEVIDHPVLDLFENVNDRMNYFDWCELMFQYQGLIGNGYTEIIYEKDMPVKLIPLLGENIIPIANGRNQGDILYYVYRPDMGVSTNTSKNERIIKPENMLHFAQYAPGNTLIGRGDLENCLSAQERYCYYDSFEKYLGLNNSRPDFVAAYKSKLNEKDMKDMYRQWNKRFGNGPQNSGKVAVTSGDLEIKPLSFSPKELEYQIGRQWSLKEIAGAFGVPEALISTTDVNRANAVESMNHYLRNTIYPKMVKYCGKLNEKLVPGYDEDLFVWFEEQYLENPVEKVQSTINAYTQGILTKNEARSAMGYEQLAEDEIQPEPVPVPPTEPQPVTPVTPVANDSNDSVK